MTNNVLQNMPNGSTVYVYGCLSLENCQVSAMDLIFK